MPEKQNNDLKPVVSVVFFSLGRNLSTTPTVDFILFGDPRFPGTFPFPLFDCYLTTFDLTPGGMTGIPIPGPQFLLHFTLL